MSRMKQDPTPKPKSPRRSDAEIALDYKKRAEAAAQRVVRRSQSWLTVNAAVEALADLPDSYTTVSVKAAMSELESAREALEGKSGVKAAPALKQTTIEDVS